MRKWFVGAACAALWLCGGVAHGQGKNSPSCGADVAVVVDVVDDSGLASDGLGPYGNGTGKVNAWLQVNNCTFDFVLNLNTSRRRVLAYIRGDGSPAVPLRLLNFDRVASVPISDPVAEGWDESAWNSFCADGIVDNLLVQRPQDNYAGCGEDLEGKKYVRRTLVSNLDTRDDVRLVMQKSPRDGHAKDLCTGGDTDVACQVSFVRVYHPDANTWILRPEPDSSSIPSAAEFRYSTSGIEHIGTHNLPFSITVTRKP